MKSLTRSKIFWTNIVAAIVAILGLLTPETLQSFGFDNTKFVGLISFIAAILSIVFRSMQTLPAADTNILKFGGRPRREKKPLGVNPLGEFVFNGNDILSIDTVTYRQGSSDEREVHIQNLITDENHQRVIFVESFEVPDIHDIIFYFYS